MTIDDSTAASLAKSLEQIVTLLQQAADARKAAAEKSPSYDFEASHARHEQRMAAHDQRTAALDKQLDERYAKKIEYRTALLTTLQRIEGHLAALSGRSATQS